MTIPIHQITAKYYIYAIYYYFMGVYVSACGHEKTWVFHVLGSGL